MLPFIILGLIALHLVLLHEEGSSDPQSNSEPIDRTTFFPSFFYKDLLILNFLLF